MRVHVQPHLSSGKKQVVQWLEALSPELGSNGSSLFV